MSQDLDCPPTLNKTSLVFTLQVTNILCQSLHHPGLDQLNGNFFRFSFLTILLDASVQLTSWFVKQNLGKAQGKHTTHPSFQPRKVSCIFNLNTFNSMVLECME